MRVLGIEDQLLMGLNESFFALGSNSISTMRLVGEARERGTNMTVVDVFRHDPLEDSQ